MKKLLYILVLNISVICFAQDPQLFENTWYLHNLIIDGENNSPPNNDEVSFVILDLSIDNGFRSSICNEMSGTLEYENSNSTFTFLNYAITLIQCQMGENQDFENIYFFSFFVDSIEQPFSYIVTTNPDGSKSLNITNSFGDQAIYGNELLSNLDFHKSQFAIHPNPGKKELFLTSTNITGNLKIKIFNIEGKLLSTQNLDFENQTSINVSNLKSGIYFLNIETENGSIETKKFLKE